MKKLYIILLVLLAFVSFAQFSVKTELKYLELINKQKNTELIENNLFNAELVSDSLIKTETNNYENSEYFFELSKSYFLAKKYELSLFSLLRQRCLFPNESVEQKSEILFNEVIYRCNLSDSISKILLNQNSSKNNDNVFSKKLELLLNLSIKLQKKKLVPPIFKIGLEYRSKVNNVPIWYQHWEFLSIINVKEKIKSVILEKTYNATPIYEQISENNLQNKIYRKAIKHYLKTNAFVQAKTIISDYEKNKLSIFLSTDLLIKKSRIFLKF